MSNLLGQIRAKYGLTTEALADKMGMGWRQMYRLLKQDDLPKGPVRQLARLIKLSPEVRRILGIEEPSP